MEADGARMHLPVRKRQDCRQHRRLEERHGSQLPSERPERTNPADTWILDFKPERWENKFLLFRGTPFEAPFYSSPWKPLQQQKE